MWADPTAVTLVEVDHGDVCPRPAPAGDIHPRPAATGTPSGWLGMDRRLPAVGVLVMSEYQYYEFLAVDRPLTAAEQAEVREFSTRARTRAKTELLHAFGRPIAGN